MLMIIFNKRYFTAFIVLILIESYIAIYIKQGFIRFVLGDYLAVILLYCLTKSFTKLKPIYTAIFILGISFCVELLQLIDILELLNINKNTLTNLVLGTTFSFEDLIAYTLGVTTILLIDIKASAS